MTTNYEDLSERTKARVDEFAYRFLQKVGDHLVANTPVVTGRMKGSWNITTSASRAAVGNKYFSQPKQKPRGGFGDSRSRMMSNVSRMAISAPSGAMEGSFSGLIGFKVQAGRPVYIVNTARAPHNDYYYPAKVDDHRGIVRGTYQAMAQFAEEAATEARGGTK
jgi:hypothetical protein